MSKPYRIARQPVVLNYRFTTPAAAARVRRGDIVLVQCQRCGLVFNTALDTAPIPYDANYENRQCFSPAFQNHLQSLADHLIGRHRLREKDFGGRLREGRFSSTALPARPATGVVMTLPLMAQPGVRPAVSRFTGATSPRRRSGTGSTR